MNFSSDVKIHMRHYKKKTTLDRKAAPRRALLSNLVESLVLYERIKTTLAKAKAVRSLTERLITVAKKNTLASRRQIGSRLYTKNVVKKLMEVLGPRYAERHGGYTRITRLKPRRGDGAEEAMIELL